VDASHGTSSVISAGRARHVIDSQAHQSSKQLVRVLIAYPPSRGAAQAFAHTAVIFASVAPGYRARLR
jgi:hypothetical protein